LTVWKTTYLRHLIGELGEKCAAKYLKSKGFTVWKKHVKVTDIDGRKGDLACFRQVAEDVMFRHFEAVDRIVEVKASYRKFPRLSNVLSLSQKAAKKRTVFILVKLNSISFQNEEIGYETREIPDGWTDEYVRDENRTRMMFKINKEKMMYCQCSGEVCPLGLVCNLREKEVIITCISSQLTTSHDPRR
jgi:hypothetical protein